MKIAVYSFGLNEQANVRDWLKSCEEADHVTFCDTGSTDGTRAEFFVACAQQSSLRQRLAIHQISIHPWRFDVAHNTALALVPADVDICIPLHMDERLQPGWRTELEAAWVAHSPSVGRNRFTKVWYDYQFAPTLTFRQNRIHARHGYVWRYPAHEGVYPYSDQPEVFAETSLKIVQTQDLAKDRMSRDLWLLELGLRENPHSARCHFYYGRQLMYARRYQEAVPLLRKYLSMPDAWPGEAAQAAEALMICYRNGAL